MKAEHTTLAALRSHSFLARRVDGLSAALLQAPDDAALWIGAGLSAKYSGLPTWTRFLHQLLEKHVSPGTRDFELVKSLLDSGRLAIAAECMQGIVGPQVLDELVRELRGESGRLPEQFAYLGVRDVITTNYDLVLESSLPGYKAVLPSSGVSRLLSNEFKIVKIHGSVAQPESCVLSLSHYVRAYNVNLNWYLTNVFSSCNVVFFGSSMNPNEPYFDVLRILRSNGRMRTRHYAVVAVDGNEAAKQLGQRLKEFGIELIPYIADEEHSFIDELMDHVESHRGSTDSMRCRLAIVRNDLQEGRIFRAAMRLWHASHANVAKIHDRQSLGDVVAEFFIRVLDDSSHIPPSDFAKNCATAGIDLPQLMVRTLDLISNSTKTIRAIHKLRNILPRLEFATNSRQPLLGRKLAEMEREIAERERNYGAKGAND